MNVFSQFPLTFKSLKISFIVLASICSVAMAENNEVEDDFYVPIHLFSGEPRGIHETGTLEELWVNTVIDDPSTAAVGDARKLMVQIWYPASLKNDESIRRASYALSPELYDNDHWVHKLAHVQTASVLNARLVTGDDRLPILIYNHGGIHPHFSATFQTEFLASHGYVVVSIGHSGANEIKRFPDGTTYVNDGEKWVGYAPEDGGLSRRDRLEQVMASADLSWFVQDISFVLDRLTKMDADPASPFHKRLDLDRVGSLGWSLGGFTSLQATRSDQRIKAAANLDGWPHGLLGSDGVVTLGMDKPVLLMFAQELQSTLGQSQVVNAQRVEMGLAAATHYWKMLGRTTADWYHITLARANHGSFADISLFEKPAATHLHPRTAHAIINAYVLEFFDKHVKGVTVNKPLLSGEQVYPEVMLLQRKGS